MKAVWNGVVIAESDDTVVVEGNHYFPESALRREYTTFSNHRTSCAWKGQAHYYSLFVNGDGVMFGNGEIWMNAICLDEACNETEARIITIQAAE